MSLNIAGHAWCYGDNVNTDVIFPGKYTYTVTTRRDCASCAGGFGSELCRTEVRPGDVIVAGRNWGCGSSREQAATCLGLLRRRRGDCCQLWAHLLSQRAE